MSQTFMPHIIFILKSLNAIFFNIYIVDIQIALGTLIAVIQ